MEKFLWALGHRGHLYYLVPGHRMDSDLEYKSSIKEVVGALAFGLVGLHVTGTFTDESFTISKNWLLLGGGNRSRVSKAPSVKTSETHG